MRNVFEREFVFLNLLKKSALKNFFKKAQSNCNPMDKQIAEYVSTTLQQMAILDTADVGFENIVIDAFKTHHENGVVFSHQNGETYGLAFLNALTQESASKITRELKKNKNLSLKSLQELVAKHRLKCYVKGGSNSYNTWKTGDLGVAFLEYDDTKKIVVPRFVNESAKDRE